MIIREELKPERVSFEGFGVHGDITTEAKCNIFIFNVHQHDLMQVWSHPPYVGRNEKGSRSKFYSF